MFHQALSSVLRRSARLLLTLPLCILPPVLHAEATTPAPATTAPVFTLDRADTLIDRWVVCGPMPASRADLLAPIGGEAKAVPVEGTSVPSAAGERAFALVAANDKAAVVSQACPKVYTEHPCYPEERDLMRFAKLPGGPGLYYLSCRIRAPRAGYACLVIQGGGLVQWWINGERDEADFSGGIAAENPHRLDSLPGRQPSPVCDLGFASMPLRLAKGDNVLLLKVWPVYQAEQERLMARIGWPPEPAPPAPGPELGSVDFRPTAAHPVSDRGDGTGIFPGARPPAYWDEAHGVNIRWRTSLPGPARSGPIVVGDRVFTVADPNWLICADAATGTIRWQRANDQLECLDPAEAEWARKEWAEVSHLMTRMRELLGEQGWLEGFGHHLYAKNMPFENSCEVLNGLQPTTPFDTMPATQARLAEIDAEMKALGLAPSPGSHCVIPYEHDSPQLAAYCKRCAELYRRAGLYFPYTPMAFGRTWCDGTPCSDGECVYASFGNGHTVCYDLDGNRRWMVWSSPINLPDPSSLHVYNTNGGVAPFLVDGRLIVKNGSALCALDCRTGRTLWRQVERSITEAQCRPMRLGATTVLVGPRGMVFRLDDGKILMDVRGFTVLPNGQDDAQAKDTSGGDSGAAAPCVDGDVAFIPTTVGLRAVRYRLDGPDRVVAEQKWFYERPGYRFTTDAELRKRMLSLDSSEGFARDNTILFDPATNRIWYGITIGGEIALIDAETGKPVSEGATSYSLCMGRGCAAAGNLVFALRSFGTSYAYDRVGGLTPVAESTVAAPCLHDIRERRMTWADYKAKWLDRGFCRPSRAAVTNGELFFQGERVYIRTDDALLCIGGP